MSSSAWYVGSTNELGLSSLQDHEGNAVLDATVTATVVDAGGNAIAGETWPITLEIDSNNEYVAFVSANAVMSVTEKYWAEYTATNSAGRVRKFRHRLLPKL